MKTAIIITTTAATVAVAAGTPARPLLTELALPAPHDYLPTDYLYPQRVISGFAHPGPQYTEETFRAEALQQCTSEPGCSTVIGYYEQNSGVINGTNHPFWFGWMFGGGRASPDNFFHSPGVEHSIVYTISE